MFKYLRVIFTRLFFVIYAYFRWMRPYSKHPEKYPLEVRYERFRYIITHVFEKFFIDYNSLGAKEILNADNGESARFFICNHQSLMDPLVFVALSDKPVTFIAKKEVKKIPFVSSMLEMMGGIYLDRENPKEELKTFINVGKRLKDDNSLNILVFIEGTRNKNNLLEPLPFKGGALKFPMKNGITIEDFSIYGTHRTLDKKVKCKRNSVTVIHNKTYSQDYYKNLNTQDLANEAWEECKNGIQKAAEFDDAHFLKINPKCKKKLEKKNQKEKD